MAISFPGISDAVRIPLFHVDFDPSQAGSLVNYRRILLLGHPASGATVAPLQLLTESTYEQAKVRYGAGAMLSRMVKKARENNKFDTIVAMSVAEPSAGTKATGSIVMSGSATASGVISLMIAGQAVPVGVTSGDTASQQATAMAAAINAATDLPVVATASTATVTTEAKWKGLTGNNIDIRVNHYGIGGGEALPAGVSVTITAMASGAGVPDLSAVFAALGDQEFEVLIHSWDDTASLNAIDAEMAHSDAGRWGWLRQLYGHAFCARQDTPSQLYTWGQARNSGHHSTWGYRGSPNPPWELAAARYATEHRAFLNDPARPVYTLPILGILAAAPALRMDKQERNDLLFAGISTAVETPEGGLICEQSITHYQKTSSGVADDSLLKVQTLMTSAYIQRSLRHRIETRFPRHKLASNGTNFGPGQAVMTPNRGRGELVAHYAELEDLGLVENAAAFRKNLIVERSTTNPNRLNVLYPPDLINQLDVFAVVNQFRLQYPAQEINTPVAQV